METLSNKIVKARKIHTCDWCLSTIRVGEKYHSSTNVESGEIYQWKSHIDCQKLAEIFLDYDNYGDGMTQDDFDTFLFEGYRDITGKPCNVKTQPYDEILNVVKNHYLTHTQDGGLEG